MEDFMKLIFFIGIGILVMVVLYGIFGPNEDDNDDFWGY